MHKAKPEPKCFTALKMTCNYVQLWLLSTTLAFEKKLFCTLVNFISLGFAMFFIIGVVHCCTHPYWKCLLNHHIKDHLLYTFILLNWNDLFHFPWEAPYRKRIIYYLSSSIFFWDEPNLGPLEEVGSKQQSSCLEDISTQSAVVVILEFLGVNSMTHIEVTKELQPLAKKLNIKHRSLKK